MTVLPGFLKTSMRRKQESPFGRMRSLRKKLPGDLFKGEMDAWYGVYAVQLVRTHYSDFLAASLSRLLGDSIRPDGAGTTEQGCGVVSAL